MSKVRGWGAALGVALLVGCGSGEETEIATAVSSAAGVGGAMASGAGGAVGAGGGCSDEVCDGGDNDCDGEVDEGCLCLSGETQPCYSADPSTEGVGECAAGEQTCDEQGSFGACDGEITPVDEICDGLDNDCDGEVDDGFGSITCGLGICQVTVEECVNGQPMPCTPGDPNPNGESCDGTDDDCNGTVDDNCPCVSGQSQACYTGPLNTQNVGACMDGTQICDLNGNWGACTGDVTPSAEQCDGVDNDCDGQSDEGNPGGGAMCNSGQPGVCAAGTEQCQNGQIACVQTLQPQNESCNGLDDDCDGQPDEGDPGGGGMCNTGQLGLCAVGTFHCQNGMIACVANTAPANESCDGQDNDCDGQTDEGNPGGGGACTSGQQGVCAAGTLQCQGGALACVPVQMPSAEQCDGLDNDCDGTPDEGNPGGGGACNSGQQGMCAPGTLQCQNGSLGCVANQSPSSEVCDGQDNDCDGQTDENNPGGGGACTTGLPGICAAGTVQCQGGALSCVQNSLPQGETCNNVDDDCDGTIDDGNPGGGMSCNSGQAGVCAAGTTTCQSGTIACVPNAMPSPEQCNNLDDDCDGTIDDGDPGGGGACSTGLPGICGAGEYHCQNGSVQCFQTNSPSAEQCDGLDNDCNGSADDGNPGGGMSCATGQPGVCAAGTTSCSGGSIQCTPNTSPSAEVCGDSLDNDCDGQTDEACGCSHPLCTIGAALTNGCNSCVSQICAVDPYCCNTSWDSICVGEVRTVCGSLTCTESAGSCPHTLCTTGPSSTPFPNSCDSGQANCVSQICAADPYCCSTDWDSICVNEVSSICGENCTYQ